MRTENRQNFKCYNPPINFFAFLLANFTSHGTKKLNSYRALTPTSTSIFVLWLFPSKRDSAYDKKEKAQGFTFHLYYPLVFCAQLKSEWFLMYTVLEGVDVSIKITVGLIQILIKILDPWILLHCISVLLPQDNVSHN